MFGLHLTNFVVLEILVAGLMVAIFVPLARRVADGSPPRGHFWNAFEALLVFLRDQVVRPMIGTKDGDRYLPLIWSLFFFILFCNLLAIVPWAGSPTSTLSVTGVLAAVVFLVVVLSGIKKFGPLGYWRHMAPPAELPLALAVIMVPMLILLEFLGLTVRSAILAIRLMANIFAEHLVVVVILGFIATAAHWFILTWLGVTALSILGAVALSLLEVLMAFIQAYIFVILASLFIGMAVHPHGEPR